MAHLEVRDLTVEYASGDYIVRPLDGLNIKAQSGQLVVLLGPSGSGKTTLLSCLAGILTPTWGSIRVDGVDVTNLTEQERAEYRRKTVGVVFQTFNLIPSLTAAENVEVPLRIARVQGARERAEELLAQVDLTDRSHHRPAELSGGQQQRVAIARALAHNPPLVLADEPTAHLDHIQVETVLALIRKLASPGRLVAVATHDDRILPLADKVVELTPKAKPTRRAPKRITVAAGELIFDQGSRGDLVYVVEEGEVDIYRIRADRTEEPVTVVRRGKYFGELGPMLGLPRSASARARRPSILVAYSLADFRRRVRGRPGSAPKTPGVRGARRPVRKGAPAKTPRATARKATPAKAPAKTARRRTSGTSSAGGGPKRTARGRG